MVILLSAVFLGCGCSTSQSDRQAVSQILEIRSKALNARNLPQYLSILSASYNDKGKDFARLKDGLLTSFQTFENVSYQPGEQTISLHGNYAETAGAYRMKISVRGKEVVLDGTEHLKLAKEPDGWKIIAGL